MAIGQDCNGDFQDIRKVTAMTNWNTAFERAGIGADPSISLAPIPVKVIDDGKLDRGSIAEQLIAGAILLAIGIAAGALAKSKGLV